METPFSQALMAGFERVTAWADLLDDINVFPVADGDTGRNLVVSLSPLRQAAQGRERITRELLLSARGNSGNIAARFFSGLLLAESVRDLAGAVRQGRDRARQAVNDPKQGTMLTVFDALTEAVEEGPATFDGPWRERVLKRLEGAVLSTPELLPKLKTAGVVDAGALGIFIFLEGFFSVLAGDGDGFRPVTEIFKGFLTVSPDFSEEGETGCCVDTVLRVEDETADALRGLSSVGESVVVLREGKYLKVHLHARDGQKARGDLAAFGKVVRWSADDLGAQVRSFRRRPFEQAIHIMTDAAGSISRETTAGLGVTLLDSYITVGERSLPETHFAPEELYAAMRRGVRVFTAQASLFERHEHYRSVLDRFPRVLYLCVGSVYTGNYEVAMEWKRINDHEDRFTIVDSTAASGRLGLLSLATARLAHDASDAGAVIRFAREGVTRCQEYVFLDKLRYLAAGGRLSKSGAFFGDMLRMKPVISPLAEGARKVGGVRNRKEQLKFAIEKLTAAPVQNGRAMIMIEYTDNLEWVTQKVQPEIGRRWPEAEIILQPMSLTSGAHMGPGTWAVAFLPECI
ncbi:MAG: DegV family EDD domain-containing protein [Deltaproteobacteria bacterium]|nr:DegV family EDD domain-containing protein [Deltaproteobacteria bacterium]